MNLFFKLFFIALFSSIPLALVSVIVANFSSNYEDALEKISCVVKSISLVLFTFAVIFGCIGVLVFIL